jgi:hypothetical protein
MWDIETKIVYLVKDHSTNTHFQSNELYGMDPSFKQVNHYGNQSLSLIGLRNTADAAHINNILFTSRILFICSAK